MDDVAVDEDPATAEDRKGTLPAHAVVSTSSISESDDTMIVELRNSVK